MKIDDQNMVSDETIDEELTDTEAELGIVLIAEMQEKGFGTEAILALGASG